MKAMILAAGLGTRLRPLTETKPKALIEVNGKPILEIIILRLKKYGFRDIIINVHHHYKQVLDFVKSHHNFGVNIQISDEREQILETGGGIKKASWFLDGSESFLVHNVDVISDIDLKEIYDFHYQRKPLATLAVKDKDSARSLLFDNTYRLCGWENRDTGASRVIGNVMEKDRTRIGFCGIHVIDPLIFKYMGEKEKFSIITTYMNAAADQIIYGYPVEENLWIDIGSFKQLDYAKSIAPEEYLN
jgi:NDP-sugar pyrophosphorylase family protein